jgi:putative ABC transport system permease protein
LIAGLYPAFVLSSFLPAVVLKGQAFAGSKTTRSAYLRRALIVFQFSAAQILIIGALVVGSQIHFMMNTNLGFKKDAVIYFNTPWLEKADKIGVLKNELSQLGEISAMSLSDQPPSYNGWSSNTAEYDAGQGEVIKVNAFRKYGDQNYLDFYGIKLLAGQNLRPIDSLREVIINRTLMNQLGISEPGEALGKVLKFDKKDYAVTGVVEDFHIQSLHKKMEPVIIGYRPVFQCFNIRLAAPPGSPDFKKDLDAVEASWKKVYPDSRFAFAFLDETLKNFYQSEQRTSKLVNTATALAVFISCLGLFGLASFTTVQRTKEIGIRKVLGSSVQNIVLMLSKDFILLVMIAFVIATPVAWMLMERWLEGFAYHMTLNVWIFILTMVAGSVIAFLTVAHQTMRAAFRNPVDSLRSE